VDSFTGGSEKHVREGSYTDDFERFVIDGSRNGAFLFVRAV
jgi:hypothetical protein